MPTYSNSSGFALRSRRKFISSNGEPTDRIKSVSETLTQVIPICTEIGVTRVADITNMDRLYLPNFSIVLPGTEDNFWVYSGKGTTKQAAKASGIMEAIERYSSLSNISPRTLVQGTYSDLARIHKRVINPAEVVEPIHPSYSDEDTIMDYLIGHDLVANQPILVPAEIALYKHSPKYPAVSVFSQSHTNGIASGNVLEEAICHSLCEVIERDAVSIAELCSSSFHYTILDRIKESLANDTVLGPYLQRINIKDSFVDDSSLFPEVDISSLSNFGDVGYLIQKFANAGLPLLIKDITQKDIGIPVFVATSVEWLTDDYGLFAKGYGAHPDARIALTRAITELSQTRAANIHGARDDLKKIEYRSDDEIYKRKWQFMSSSSPEVLSRKNENVIKFSEVETYVNTDILDDIWLILQKLERAKLKKVVIVDLTLPCVGIPVVRSIVPGLETFEVTSSLMGNRAAEYFREYYHL